MNRASVILKNAREDKSLEVSEISKKLKISKTYLEAIEAEDIGNFPAEPYCTLIIKDYATFLGLNGEDILSLFRRDYASPVKSQPVKNNQFSFTPQAVFKFGVMLAVVFFVTYIITEYLKFNRPPQLEVIWPEEQSIVQNSNIEISGTTDPEATIKINNDPIIIDQSGNFHKSIVFQNSELKVIVESTSHSGKTTIAEKTYQAK